MSSVYNQHLGELSRMTFKDWGAAWLEVHAEVMKMDESFDKMWEKEEQRVKQCNLGTTHHSRRS